jgi:hypothetical protein
MTSLLYHQPTLWLAETVHVAEVAPCFMPAFVRISVDPSRTSGILSGFSKTVIAHAKHA